jgi:hypothetical protein
MLLDEAVARPPVIDFLHPRRRPPPPNKRRTYVLAGGVAASLLAAGAFFVQYQLWGLDDQISRLTAERTRQQKAAIASEQPLKDAYQLDLYAAGDVNWLDELSRTSTKFPPPTAARVSDLTATVPSKGTASIRLQGFVDNSARIVQIERLLQDGLHGVEGDGGRADQSLKGMTMRFNETVFVSPKEGVPTPPKPFARSRASKAGGAK